MANNDKENKIKKFTKEAIGKTLNQFNKEIGIADLVEINKNQDRILNGILSQVNDENTEKTEKSNIITLDNSTDGIVELKEIQGDTNVNVSKIEEMPITHDIGDKEGNVFTLNEIPKGAISIGEIQGNTMVNCNKDDKKELVLMKDLSTQGDNNITLTEGVDGGKVDVALEGNTLVNVSKTKDTTALPLDEELTYLYANTQYTVQFIADKAITADITLGGTSLLAQSIVAGLNKISITTPSELVDNKLIINGAGAKISEVVVTDTDREFKYFEGMKSVGECEELEVISRNKNEINIPTHTYSFANKTFQSHNITFPIMGKTFSYRYDYEITSISEEQEHFDTNLAGSTITTPNSVGTDFDRTTVNQRLYNGAKGTVVVNNISKRGFHTLMDIRCIRTSTPVTMTYKITNFALYFSDNADIYTPNQSNTQQLTHEPLRAVGDAKDRYVLIDGKWYIERKCQQISFTNNINYWINAEDDTFIVFQCAPNAFTNLTDCSTRNKNIIVDKKVEVISISSGAIYVKLSKDIAYDVESFKNYLPINLVIPVASPIYEPINYNPFETYSDTTHITANSLIPTNITIKNHGFNCLLKPSTTYTISSNLGLNTVTTGADIGDSCLCFHDEDTSDVTTMKDVLVLEGDWTNKANLIPSNFNGIESAFEQELVTDENNANYGKYKVTAKVVGKNLVDSIVTDMKHPTGKYVCSPNYSKFKGVIPLPRGTYRLSFERSFALKQDSCIFIWSNDGKKIQQPISMAFEIKPNDVGITWYCSTNVNDIPNIVRTHIQVESGTQVTAYEPYKESNITFYLNEPLRGVEGVKDRVFIKDDKVVVERNCASYTFDGSTDEGWSLYENTSYKDSTCISMKNPYKLKLDNSSFSTLLCDKLQYIKSGYSNNLTNISTYVNDIYNSNHIYIRIMNAQLSSSNKQGVIQWLQQNPTTVVYQLAEPTYEEVKYSSNRLILDTFNNESFNNSTLFLDTTISPKLSFKPLYEELVYVKNSTKYYIQFNAVGSGEVVINLGGTELTTEIAEGYNCIPITTPSESTNLMTMIGQGITISEVIVSEVICGGYYKGLQSCFEEHIENGKYRVLLRGIALDGSKVNGIKLYINEPLRGIGDIKDRLCIKNGKLMVERKCGKIVLDGSEGSLWSILTAENSSIIRFYTNKLIENYDNIKLKNICDKFITSYSSTNNFEYIYLDKHLIFGIDESKIEDISSNSFMNWLQQNPVTVVYQLVEPVYEEVTNEYGLPIVFEGYENGIVYIDSVVTPTTHIKYTSNNQLATTLSEAEEQNIATQEDINMNVITYMMDIDMMLTDMEMSNDISVMAVRRDSSNENMLDRMSDEDKKVYRDNTVVMLEKMITANVLEKEDIEGRINMYYNKNRISKEQYKYLKSLL